MRSLTSFGQGLIEQRKEMDHITKRAFTLQGFLRKANSKIFLAHLKLTYDPRSPHFLANFNFMLNKNDNGVLSCHNFRSKILRTLIGDVIDMGRL